jgi:hypothetical protein
VQETSQKSSNVPKERRDKKRLVLVCRLTLAFSRPLLGEGGAAKQLLFSLRRQRCNANNALSVTFNRRNTELREFVFASLE